MKTKKKRSWFRIAVLICFVATSGWFMAPRAHATNDLDDVESDVDSVTSESEAAQNEAADEQKRAEKEKENLAKAKKAARAAEKDAQVKGDEAKSEITVLDTNIRANQKLRAKFDADKAWALRVIAKAQKRLATKKDALAKASAEMAAAKSERDLQNKNIEDLKKEEKATQDSIAKNRLDRDNLVKEIAALKQKLVEAQGRLDRQRETARLEAEKKDKLKAEQDATKRKISSIPNKVIVRSPKVNCDVTDQASDGAAKIGAIKAGTKYDLYRVVNTRWVELQYGDHTGFAAKTCF